MNLSDLSSRELRQLLHGPGIYLCSGEFVSCIKTRIPQLIEDISTLYCEYPLASGSSFADFHISLERPFNFRRWFHKQVFFYVDKQTPFKPLPLDQAFALLEWGLNWCVSTYANHRLILHAAVVEKNGSAMIMPGLSGSGKSTLCAALIGRGWRLLSDELAIISLQNGMAIPLPRPVSLKNESIDVIRYFNPEAVIGRVAHDTAKGTVAHMRVPSRDIASFNVAATPAWIIFPKFVKDAPLSMEVIGKGQTTIHIVNNSFNCNVLGRLGFDVVTQLVDQCDCYRFEYSDLDCAIEKFDLLAECSGIKADEQK